MSNAEIAKILLEMSEMLEADSVPFKPQAYRRAHESVLGEGDDLADIYQKGGLKALKTIPGVGENIALKIEEYLKTGKVKEYGKMKKQLPADFATLTAIEGLGPKGVKALWQKLKIKNLKDLEAAARKGRIADIPRFGPKSQAKILQAIELFKKHSGRFSLGAVLPFARTLAEKLKKAESVKMLAVAGSVRRFKETIGDIDLLAVSDKPSAVMNYFATLPEVTHIYARGETKSSVKMTNGMDADLRVVPQVSYGAALNYFTGSKDHNVALRERAVKLGLKLNEYGLFRGQKQIAGKTEPELYRALGLAYIEPEMRENRGEIALAEKNKLPKLIGYSDLKGDLQVQTDWTDGEHSIMAMALAAAHRGLEYIAITDHTKTLAMTGGLDEKRLLKQMAEVDRVNLDLKKRGVKLKVLKGAEVNILADGSLDIEDAALAKLDCVGGAVHSHFKLSSHDQTARVIRAMENPHLDILFHPTGRKVLSREPIDIDFGAIILTALKTKTILEIDAHPDRLDLNDEHIFRARAAGCRFAVDSDAHAASHFDLLEYGIATARRGWCQKSDVINTLACQDMLRSLKRGGIS